MGLDSRLRPWFEGVAQALVGPRHLQHAKIVETMSDDLQSDRQPLLVVTGTDRGRRLLGAIEWCGECGMLPRLVWVTTRCWLIGRISRDRRGGAEQKIVVLARGNGLFAHEHDLREGARAIDCAPT